MKTLRQHRTLLGWFMTCLMVLWLPGQHAYAVNGVWNVDAASNWNTSGSWVGGTVATGAGSVADLSQVNLTAARTITLTAPETIGRLILNDNNHRFPFTSPVGNFAYTIASNTLTLDNSGSAALISVLGGGQHIISSALVMTAGLNAQVDASSLVLSGVISGTGPLNVNGGGTLFLQNNGNTYTGGTNVNSGSFEVQTGGGTLPLTSGIFGAGDVTLTGGQLNLRYGGGTSNNTVTFNNNLVIGGASTISVDRNTGSATGNNYRFNSLSIGNSILTVNSGNSYRFEITGATNLNGKYATFGGSSEKIFTGSVGGTGAMNVTGGTVRLANATNTYAGGSNIFNGAELELSSPTAALPSSGAVLVNPGGRLSVNALSQIASNVELVNQQSGLAAVAINNAATGITAPLTLPNGGYYDSAVLIDVGTYTSTIDLTQINGGAGVWLGAAQNATINGTGAVIANSAGNYQIGTNASATTTLTFGAANILTGGSNNIIVGDPRNRIGAVTQGTGTVVINQNQNFGGITKVNPGSILRIDGAAAINSPLSSGTVFIPGGTLLVGNNDNSGANLANTTFNLTQRGVLELDNRGVTTAGGTSNLRLLNTSVINLSNSTLRLRASATNATNTIQNVADVNVRGSSVIDLQAGGTSTTAESRDAELGVTNLNRVQNGVLRIVANVGGQLGLAGAGNDVRLKATNINGVATGTVGMVSPWIINQSAATTPSFVGYNATNGFVNTTYTTGVATGGTGVEIYDYTVDTALTGNISAQAIRLGMVAANNPAELTGATRLITLVPNSNPMTEGGVIMRNTGTADATHTVNWSFGDTGNKEAIFWAYQDRAINIDGRVSATNLTKAGPNLLRLRGDNRNNLTGAAVANGLNGNINVNEGILSATNQFALGGSATLTTTPYVMGATLVLNGGAFKSEVNALFNTDVVNQVTTANVGFSPGANVPAASGIYANNVNTSYRNLIINAAVPATSDPMMFNVATNEAGGQLAYFRGTATINATSIIHTGGTFPTNGGLFIDQTLNGTSAFDKWGVNPMYVAGDSSATYSQPINVYQGTLASANATAAKPYGTGNVTVYPNGNIRYAHPDNFGPSQVTIRSDRGGLGGLGIAYIGMGLPSVTWEVAAGAPTDGVIAIDTFGYNQALDMSTMSPNGTAVIGSTLGGMINSPAWTAGAGSTFRFGGGGGTVTLNSDIATGATNLQLGVFSNTDQGASITPSNSGVQLNLSRPQSFTGAIRLNGNGSQLFVNYANQDFIGSSATQVITSSGGAILAASETGMRRLTPNITINNPIVLDGGGITFGDNFSSGGATYGGINFGGTITMNNGTAGFNAVFASNVVYNRPRITGTITDNGLRTDFTKSGTGVLSLDSTTNSWSGNTYVTGGYLAVTADNNIPLSSSLIAFNGGGIAVVDNNVTTSRRYQMVGGGNGFFLVGSGLKLTQSTSSSIFGEGALIKLGNGIMELNGTNAQNFIIASGGILQVNNPSSFSDTEGAGDRIQLGGFGGLGGVLRINTTMSTNSGIVAVNSGNSSNSGAIDVTAGNTFVVNGVISSGTEFDRLYKTGAGTMIMQGANTLRNLSVQNGTLRFSNNQPWSNAADVTNTIRLVGGTLHQVNTTANQTVAPGTGTGSIVVGYGAGGTWMFESAGNFSTQTTVTNLVRDDAGTLVIATGGTTILGTTGNNTARLIPTGQIFGVAVASANVNSILAPSIVTSNAAGVADFATYVDATNGIRPYLSNGGASVTSLSGALATQIGDISAPQNLTAAINPIYAFRTTADVTGTGRLVIPSLTNQTMGGIVINGSNTISAPIEFNPGTGVAGGSATSGEGLVYVAGVPGGSVQNATISGAITANRFTKSGLGNLTLTGNQMLLGVVSVQNGILKIGTSNAINGLQTDLAVNNTGTVDLNGLAISVDTLSSSSAATTGGGVVGTSTGTARLIVGGVNNGTYQGRIVDAVGGGSGTTTLIKAGTGTLVLGAGTGGGGGEWAPNSPDSGFNTYSGGTQIYGGTLEIRNPNALGGANGATVGAVDLYGGTLALRDHSNSYVNNTNDIRGVPESVMILGDSNTTGATFNVRGPATIDANRFQVIGNMGGQAQAQGIYQIGALNVSNNTLTVTGGNSYRLRVAGTTNLTGNVASFSTGADLLSGTIQFDGQITGSGQLNKLGGGIARRILINNTTNNYSGGTSIVGGAVQVMVNSGTPLGTGPVKIMPDAALVVWGNGALGGASLSTISRAVGMGVVGLADDFAPTFLNATNFGSRFNTVLHLGTVNWNTALNMANIGDGTSFLGALATGTSTQYLAPTLGAGATSSYVPAATGGIYRIGGGGNTFIFGGTDNVLTDSGANPTFLQIGNPRSNSIRTGVIGAEGTVTIRNYNNFTGGTQIAVGSTLQLDSGAGFTGQRPLGTGDIEVLGTFSVGGVGAVGDLSYNTASFYNATDLANHNTLVMRPGGIISISATAGVDVGGQGKWADATGQDLNGGSFRYIGDQGVNSVEQIGTLTIRKDSSIVVSRQNAGTAELAIAGLTRVAGGTLLVQTGTAALLGIPDVATQNALQYERLTVTTAPSVSGTTINGSGATGGIVAPWMINSSNNTFMSYTAGSGFQPVVANTATPNYGQVAYSAALTGTIASGGTGVGVVDVTGAVTLNANLDHYAIRSNQNISPGSSSVITTRSGGLILNGGTINQASPNTQNMTLNFGVGGASEALIYTGGNSVVNAAINAAGLTKFGGSQLQLQSANNNITGPVYLNAGTLLAIPMRSTTGATPSAATNIFNNQTVYLNNASLRIAGRLGNANDTVANVLPAGGIATMVNFGSPVVVRGFGTLDNNGDVILQRIPSLTFDDSTADQPVANSLRSPLSISIAGIDVTGTTTLGARSVLRATFGGTGSTILRGQVTGGILEKWDNGYLMMANGTNNFASLIVGPYQVAGGNTATSTVGSMIRTGNPFGTGSITVEPGASLRLADPSNIAGNSSITVYSDDLGVGGLGIAYDGAIPAFGAGAGQVNFVSTSSVSRGVIALDIGMYTQVIDQSTLAAGGKHMWIGASQSIGNTNSIYFAPTLTGSSDGVIRLGGGGNQGNLVIGAGAFEGVLSGSGGVQLGILPANYDAATPHNVMNGNIGSIQLLNRNLGLSGNVWLNGVNGDNSGGDLSLGNSFALGNAVLKINGGTIQMANTVSPANQLDFVGSNFVTAGGNDITFRGNVNLAPNGAGGTRNFNMAGTAMSFFRGVISGADSNVIKNGAQWTVFSGENTYTGATTISGGGLWTTANVAPGVNGPFGNSFSPINLGSAILGSAGEITLSRDIAVSGVGLIVGRTLQDTTITAGIAIASTQSLTVNQTTTSVGNFRGGRILLNGPISGPGALFLGDTSGTDNRTGTIYLGADANGYSANNYTGGTTIRGARIQIAADTYYTGLASAPTIISGPFGTGSINLGNQDNAAFGVGDNGMTFEATGGPRTVLNTLNAINRAADSTMHFAGTNNLTFTSSLNINSDGTARSRTFATRSSNGVLTLAGNITSSSAQGANFNKAGVGVLVLTGTNTNANTLDTSTNYGSAFFINEGVLSVSANTQLGSTNVPADPSASGSPHASAGSADVRLGGGILRVTETFAMDRQVIMNAGSAIEVTDTKTLTLNLPTNVAAVGTAAGLRKLGNGTLEMNYDPINVSLVNIGGVFTTAGGRFGAGQSGGTVRVNTAGASTTLGDSVGLRGGNLVLSGNATAQAVTLGTGVAANTFSVGGGGKLTLVQGTGATVTSLTAGLYQREAVPGALGTSQGTLTLVPTTIANLSVNERFISATGAPTPVNGMVSPHTVVRATGASQDANFVTYVANGFALHTGTTSPNLGTSAATNIGNITAADIAGAGNIDIYALRTDSNISPTDGTTLVRIGSGGLILNGGGGPDISANLLFGTGTGSNLAEALVYVRDGQSAASTLSGSFTAANFTKFGPGNLHISGTNNVMYPVISNAGTVMRTLAIQEGSLTFAGQSSVPANALILPNDSGTFNVNGLSLTVAGLGYNGNTYDGTLGTGIITNNGASAATITLATQAGGTISQNYSAVFGGLIKDGSSSLALSFLGSGTQMIATNNTYSGGTTIGTTRIVSASGVYTPLGTLRVDEYAALGTGTVTLAGGILNSRSTRAFNEVIDNVDVHRFGYGNGYDIVVAALNSFGSANTTSTLSTDSTVAFQGINTLTINAPVLSTGGGSTSGFLVDGATTVAGNTVLNIGQQLVLSGKINATGSTLTKIGASTLFLTHSEPANGNAIGSWVIAAGAVESRLANGSSNPMGASAQITLNGATWNIRHDGDNFAGTERLTTHQNNNVTIGSTAAISGASFVPGQNATIDARTSNGAANKTIVMGNLTFGGTIGSQYLTATGANGYSYDWNNVTMTKDGYFSTGVNNTIRGAVTGGTLMKQGAGSLFINSNTSTNSGTWVREGSLFFGAWEGVNVFTPSTTAKLGAGHILIQPGTAIQFESTGNLNGSQRVDLMGGDMDTLPMIRLAGDFALDAVNFRAASAGARVPLGGTNDYFFNTRNSNGVLALNAVYNTAIDMARIGDGTWVLGSTNNLNGLNGSYNAATLGIGRNSTYILGGGGATLYFGSDGVNSNALTDGGRTANVIIGTPLHWRNYDNVGAANGRGTVIYQTGQNYTGSTVVNRGSILEFRDNIDTTSIDTWGTVTASRNGTFIGVNTITTRAGSEIRLDNNFGLLPAASSGGRWGDSTALTLNQLGVLRLRGSNITDVSETIGQVTVNGQGQIAIERQAAARGVELVVPGITRGTNGMIILTHSSGALGSDERLIATGGAASLGGLTNGILPAWVFSQTDGTYLTYNEFGVVNAGFNKSNGLATASSILSTDRLFINADQTIQAGQNINAWAMRMDGATTISPGTTATPELLITGSGGLLRFTNNAGRINTHTVFGSVGTPMEALIFVNENRLSIGNAGSSATGVAVLTVQPQLVATRIIKGGGAILALESEQINAAASNGGALAGWTGFQGDIVVNQGTLELRSTLATSTVGGNAPTENNIIMNGPAVALQLFGRTTNVTSTAISGITTGNIDIATSFNNQVTIASGIPLAQIVVNRQEGTGNRNMAIEGGITFQGSPGLQGQTLLVQTQANTTNQLIVYGGLSLSGTAGSEYNNIRTDTPMFVAGNATGANAILIKTGSSSLNLWGLNAQNTYSGGTILAGGTLEVRATRSAGLGTDGNIDRGGLGTGPITLNEGTLNLRMDGDNNTTIRIYNFGNDIIVGGSSAINIARLTANGGSNKQYAFNNLTIGSQTLTVTSADGWDIRFNGTTTLTGNPTIAAGTDFILAGAINGVGSNIHVTSGALWTNTTTSSLAGGSIYVSAADLRFGTPAGNSTTATFGAGNPQIQINNSGRIVWAHANNVPGAGQLRAVSGGASLARVRLEANLASFTPAILQSRITSDSNGTLFLNGAYSQALDLSLIGNGRFFLGGSNTYSAATLGVGAGNAYRLGGEGGTLTLDAAAGGVLTGANSVIIGSQMANGTGTIITNDVNNYTGSTIISRGSALHFTPANTATPAGGLGTGAGTVHVFGELRATGTDGSFKNSAGTANLYAPVLYPGSILRLQDANATGVAADRWHDTTAISLNSSQLFLQTANAAVLATETVGDINFDRGSRIQLSTQSTARMTLTTSALARGSNYGTLVFQNSAAGRLGATPGNNSEHVIVSGTAPANVAGKSIMPGYYIAGTDNTFVTYSGTPGVGITRAAFTHNFNASPFFIDAATLNNTSIVDVSTAGNVNALLSGDVTLFALRQGNNDLSNGAGQQNTITFAGSGADVGGYIFSGGANRTLTPNLKFGDAGTADAYLYVAANAVFHHGDITAGKVIKFGNGQWVISKDQSDAARGPGNGYSNGWVVNEGQIQAVTFGSLGNAVSTNTVILNGNTSGGQASSATLFLRAAAGNPLDSTYTSGKITMLDRATIDWDSGAADRTSTIAAIDLVSMNTSGIAEGDARFTFNFTNNRARNYLKTGEMTLTGNSIVEVTALSGGTTSGVMAANLAGTGNLTKWGPGYLYVLGANNSYSGNITIEQGALAAVHADALGSGTVTINRHGVLDVQVAGFTKAATYNTGSIERWSVDGARTGTLNLGAGTLQVNADQNQTVAVTMTGGGGIEGYLSTQDNVDGNSGGVFRTLGSNVTFAISGTNYLGQRYTEGSNGLDSGLAPRVFDPYNNAGRGVMLEIKGVISGSGSIVKTGHDTVTISGANTYAGSTDIQNGTLRLGVNDATPSGTTLTTRGNAILDLNGFNTTVGQLTSPAVINGGYITNTASVEKTLTTNTTTNSTYGGNIQNNVALTKAGTSTLTLSSENTYIGKTTISGGTLVLGNNGTTNANFADSRWVEVGSGAILDTSGRILGGANGGLTYDGRLTGGGIDGPGTTYATVTNAARISTGAGGLVIGDHQGAYLLAGTMAPGAAGAPLDINTAGNQLGHIYTSGNLTLSGQLNGTASTTVDRLALQITTATVNATTLGAFDYTGTWLTTNAASYLTSTAGSGSLAGHDYLNVAGTLTLNHYGRVVVSNLGGSFAGGDVFNLLDWGTLTNNGFTVNGTPYDGTGDGSFDLDLPSLTAGLLWDTSLFTSHGVIFVVPEPSRALFLMLGLLGLMMRRRRKMA
jgi:autotransporter-associated beta strand protein